MLSVFVASEIVHIHFELVWIVFLCIALQLNFVTIAVIISLELQKWNPWLYCWNRTKIWLPTQQPLLHIFISWAALYFVTVFANKNPRLDILCYRFWLVPSCKNFRIFSFGFYYNISVVIQWIQFGDGDSLRCHIEWYSNRSSEFDWNSAQHWLRVLFLLVYEQCKR